ncbi:MAG: STAS domain-containing protein [Verrucomicrobiales bacterium]|nr:STAS domain-containing protein [Verrucomicrobiales bacterium]
MTLSYHQAGSVLEIAIEEPHFEAGAARKFEEEVHHGPAFADAHSLNIDMGHVERIDSLAVHSLLALQEMMPQPQSVISLINPQPPVHRVLRMLRLDRVFRIESRPVAAA